MSSVTLTQDRLQVKNAEELLVTLVHTRFRFSKYLTLLELGGARYGLFAGVARLAVGLSLYLVGVGHLAIRVCRWWCYGVCW